MTRQLYPPSKYPLKLLHCLVFINISVFCSLPVRLVARSSGSLKACLRGFCFYEVRIFQFVVMSAVVLAAEVVHHDWKNSQREGTQFQDTRKKSTIFNLGPKLRSKVVVLQRLCKVTECYLLRSIMCKSCQHSADSNTAALQIFSGINISIKTVCQELHGMVSMDEQIL